MFPNVNSANAKVSDGSQPPVTLNLSLSESAGSRSLDRLVRLPVSCLNATLKLRDCALPCLKILALPPQLQKLGRLGEYPIQGCRGFLCQRRGHGLRVCGNPLIN